MNDFIEWVCDPDTPAYMLFLFIVSAGCCGIFLLVSMIIAIIAGYWLIPVIVLIIAPAYVVINAYLQSKKGTLDD